MAGLNLGISVAIWSFVPIFVAVPDRIFFNVKIENFHIIGMFLLIAMTILEALSDKGEEVQELAEVKTAPVAVAILFCFIYPVVATLETFFVTKYTSDYLKLDSIDFVVAF